MHNKGGFRGAQLAPPPLFKPKENYQALLTSKNSPIKLPLSSSLSPPWRLYFHLCLCVCVSVYLCVCLSVDLSVNRIVQKLLIKTV